jgi:hypothetical protein
MSKLAGPAAKIGLVVLEILGVLVAAVAGLSAYVVWRVQSGPVSLAFLRPAVETALEGVLGGARDMAIGALRLEKGAGGEFLVVAEKVALADASGLIAGDFARIDAAFALKGGEGGGLAPSLIVFHQPSIAFVRDAERKLEVDAKGLGGAEVFRALRHNRFLRGAFRAVEFRDAELAFKDMASGRAWKSKGARAEFRRTGEGFAARAQGDFDIDGAFASLALDARYVADAEEISVELDVAKAPVGDLLEMFFGPRAAVIDAPVSGAASLRLTRGGAVADAAFNLTAGAGILRLGARTLPVASITAQARFLPGENRFRDVSAAFDAAGVAGTLSGAARLINDDAAGRLRKVAFDFSGKDIRLDPEGVFEAPIDVVDARVAGEYDLEARALDLEAIAARFLGVALEGSLSLAGPPRGSKESPGLAGSLRIIGALDPRRLALGWPKSLAVGVRQFIDTRLPAARVENVAARFDFKVGDMNRGPLPDEALTLTFDVSDATAIYTPGMTPLSGASGRGRLTGNRFTITGANGRVGDVVVSDGVIDFTKLSPKGAPVTHSFTAVGETRAMLGVLDEEPLALLRTTSLEPAQFFGRARARVTITRPNLRDVDRSAYGYAGVAEFADMTIQEFYRGIDLTKAAGRVDLRTRSMTFAAAAELGGAPIKVSWLKRFYGEDGPSKFDVSGTVDSATGDVFGFPTRQMFRGPVPFAASASGEIGALRGLSLAADFTGAALNFDLLGWRKAPGVRASGALDATFTEEGVDVSSLRLDGEGAQAEGELKFGPDGAFREARFARVKLEGAADFSGSAARTAQGGLEARITGALADAGPLVERLLAAQNEEKPAADPAAALRLEGRLDRLLMRGGAEFSDASLDLLRVGEELHTLEFSARSSAGKPVSLTLKATGADSGPAQIIEGRSDDIGALLAGVFGIDSIRGGEGSLEIDVASQAEGGGLGGRIEARGMRVVKAPLLAKVFAAGSLTGLADLLNGEGIELSQARARFGVRKGAVTISEARATGPSVGLSGAGTIGSGSGGAVELTGAVAPAYQVNSLLGKTPLLGEIFVNRDGEGLVALSYSVSGSMAAPTVSVNPLSALAPGVLRRMFEGGRDDAAPAGEGGEN